MLNFFALVDEGATDSFPDHQATAFKENWLAIALPSEEFELTKPVPAEILKGLYPEIYLDGPNAEDWYQKLGELDELIGRVTSSKEKYNHEYYSLFQGFQRTYGHKLDTITNLKLGENQRIGHWWLLPLGRAHLDRGIKVSNLISYCTWTQTNLNHLLKPGEKTFGHMVENFSSLILLQDLWVGNEHKDVMVNRHYAFLEELHQLVAATEA